MIRKIINPDGSFGSNYDEELKAQYLSSNIWPESNYIELTSEQANIIDSDLSRFEYKADIPGLFLGNPMGVVERANWAAEELDRAKAFKYARIIALYEYACKHYMCNIRENLYGVLSWIPTWKKVVEFHKMNQQTICVRPIRFYEKDPKDLKFHAVSMDAVSVSDLDRYIYILESSQFKILQEKRNAFLIKLATAKTISEVQSIKVYYGFTLDESNPEDLKEKVQL